MKSLKIHPFLFVFAIALLTFTYQSAYASKKGLLASIKGESFSTKDLSPQTKNALRSLETDRYLILKGATNQWLEDKLLKKEANAQNISEGVLLHQEVASKIDRNFRDTSARAAEYARLKQAYLKELKKKYEARILLERPKGFKENAESEPSVMVSRVYFHDLAGRPSTGPEDAPVTLVEFGDYHCPFCKSVQSTLKQIMSRYPGQIYRVFRHFPLSNHPAAKLAHSASECAHQQGNFWDYHDRLFNLPGSFAQPDQYLNIARQLGLDVPAFSECLEENANQLIVEQDIQAGIQAGVRGTPATFLNGIHLSGARPYKDFATIIDQELATRT